jgi:glycosyltransferase involved in cell wall biosynthesis
MSKIKGIKYVGPIFDNSGYAKACRGNIFALLSQGIEVTLVLTSFEKSHPNLGKDGELLKTLINKAIEYDVVIVHTTPEFWPTYKESGKKMVNYTIWETTKLHPDWVPYINDNADKVLVGCDWNISIFKDSGVTIPIGCIPHSISLDDSKNVTPYSITGINDNTYVFYSIFQWTERKDPLSLIKAYWYAFQNNENVALVLKTYRSDYSDGEKDSIRQTIKRLKYVTKFDTYPKIYFIPDMLTEDEIRGLHVRGDCYVSADRGEGFGLSPFTAGANANPVVATGFGGSLEYLNDDNSFLAPYTLTPVHGMPWSPWYRADQLWAQVDVFEFAKNLQRVYSDQESAFSKGNKLQKHIRDNFSHEVIGARMVKEIEEIL